MNQPRILVVEDEAALREGLKAILEEEGYTVLTAPDGLEALQVMKESPPDLIVADIMMPRMDGYVLYDVVRARLAWATIPFIFLTAKGQREEVLKGKEMGAEDYITKPFDPEELTVAVRARLGRAKAIRRATEEEFDQLKQQITTVLSHELRTPLTYILGYTDLALDNISSLPMETLKEFLGAVKQGANRLARLVEDILVLVQLDTGRAAEDYRLFSNLHHHLDVLIKDTVKQYEEQATARGVTLETRVEPGFPPLQLSDSFFRDALGRLVDNAIKFSPGQGRRVTVSAQADESWVEVAVRDEGRGIPPDEIDNLFQRFSQVGREQLEQQGAGLGLAIAKELIRLHGGEIAVESKLGAGSTFTIRLPVTNEPSADSQTAERILRRLFENR